MKIIIKATNLKLNQALKDFIERKINDLEKFLPPTNLGFNTEGVKSVKELSKVSRGQPKKYFNGFFGKGKPRIEAWVEIGKTTLHHRKGSFFRAECQMRLPGKNLRSEVLSEDLRKAIVWIKDELQRQMKQYKNKIMAKTKRGNLEFKKSLRLSPATQIKRKKGQRIREEGI